MIFKYFNLDAKKVVLPHANVIQLFILFIVGHVSKIN